MQVGLDPPHRVVLADSPEVRRLLDDLRCGRRPPAGARPTREAALARLVGADLVLDARAPTPPAGSRARPDVLGVASTRAWAGQDAATRLEARARLRVCLAGPSALVEPLGRLLAGAGVDLRPPATGGDLVVVIGDGEPRRAELDQLVRDGVPHLLVWSRGGLPRVGPLVVPGVTACLRCVDAHESESDPRRPLLLEQASAEPAPLVRDPALTALAIAWTARDVLRYAEGEPPTSWSATVLVPPGGLPEPVRWTRHPCCGCAWDTALHVAG